MVNHFWQTMNAKSLHYFFARRGVGRSSSRSLANWTLNQAEQRLGRSYLFSNPTYMQIEPTTSCNLTCGACGLQTAWSELRDRGSYIKRETVEKAIPFLKTARLVILQGWGESLLHPDFLWMVETCKRQGTMVGLLTNGVLISEEVAEALVALNMDLLGISIDAVTPETFKKVRGGDFSQVEAGLERLRAAKRARRTRFPMLQISFCVMKQNLHELPILADFSKRHEIDEVKLSNLIVYNPKLADQPVFDIPDEVRRINAEAETRAKRSGILWLYDGVERQNHGKAECPYSTFSVLSDGAIGPCGAQRVLMGNIYDAPLRELWNSPAYLEMRRAYAQGDLPHTCKHCPNFTNEAADHVTPDMTYVESTLAARRWELTAGRSECGSHDEGPGSSSRLLQIGGR